MTLTEQFQAVVAERLEKQREAAAKLAMQDEAREALHQSCLEMLRAEFDPDAIGIMVEFGEGREVCRFYYHEIFVGRVLSELRDPGSDSFIVRLVLSNSLDDSARCPGDFWSDDLELFKRRLAAWLARVVDQQLED